MAEPFRVDPTVLADAVARMAEFGRHVEELVAEIESLVTRLYVTWTGRARRLMLRRNDIGLPVRR